jgi:hypothetical protein
MSKITNLYYANLFVDTVQNAKNQFLDTFVWDEKVKAPMKSFVEAQREFTKQVNRSASEVIEYSFSTAKDVFENTKKSV